MKIATLAAMAANALTLLNASGFNLRTRQPPRKTGNIARSGEQVALVDTCRSDLDCELLGTCTADPATGMRRCVCSPSFRGLTCGSLDLLPMPASAASDEDRGFQGVHRDRTLSAWNAMLLWR